MDRFQFSGRCMELANGAYQSIVMNSPILAAENDLPERVQKEYRKPIKLQ
jgi:hypothetical protein